jgi:hypothetical protein
MRQWRKAGPEQSGPAFFFAWAAVPDRAIRASCGGRCPGLSRDPTVRMHVGGSARLGLFADVFNVTNQGEALRVFPQPGPNLGLPLLWTDPCSARAGAHVEF